MSSLICNNLLSVYGQKHAGGGIIGGKSKKCR
jgi:hypothetical protein